MVVDDLNVERAYRTGRPFEANAPLLVDPDGPLASSIASERLQSIAGTPRQVRKCCSRIQNLEALVGLSRKSLELANEFALRELPGSPVPIAQDHARLYILDAVRQP